MAKTASRNLTTGSPTRLVIGFLLPLLGGLLFQQLYNMVDTLVVGRFLGMDALAGVGSTSSVNFLVLGFCIGICNGFVIPVAQKFGEGDEAELRRFVANSIWLSAAFAVVLTVATALLCTPVLRWMNTPDNIFRYAYDYIFVIFLGIPAIILYNLVSGVIRSLGDSRTPIYFLVLSSLLNVALDLLAVAVLGMGVTGAAIATIVSQFFSAILTLIALLRTQDSYRLIVSKIRFHRDLLFDIIKIGLPAGLQSAMYSISNLLIQSSINSFGTDTIAAWTAYGKVDSIFWMIMGAYGVSITTFAGQNFGAGKYDRIKKSVRICLGLAAVTSLFLSFIVLNFGGTILLLFTRDTNVINICIGMMRVVSPAYITYICIEILSGTCRGCGDSFFPMLLTCFGVCVLRILWITIAVPLRHEVATVAFSYPLTWTITSILFILYYKRGKWMQKDTLRNAPQGQGKDA